MRGQDAVLVALGPRSLRKNDVQEVLMRNLSTYGWLISAGSVSKPAYVGANFRHAGRAVHRRGEVAAIHVDVLREGASSAVMWSERRLLLS